MGINREGVVMVKHRGLVNGSWLVLWAAVLLVATGVFVLPNLASRSTADSGLSDDPTHASPHDSANAAAHSEASNSDRFPVHINRPSGPPALRTDEADSLGRAVRINCSTCHTIREPNLANSSTDDLDEFHQDLTVQHGALTCVSCHNPKDYDTLRLANEASVPFEEVMKLCGQCHGPQTRDYNNGAHGGMTGYWDLTRGPRYRNNCIDCHDPHAPQFPMMQPTFKPIDRFLDPHDD